MSVRDAAWYRTGVGSPLPTHSDFSRVGAQCPPNTVMTGVSFRRGGGSTSNPVAWTQRVQDNSTRGNLSPTVSTFLL